MHFVNGKSSTQVSIHDRGLAYGQSVFETIAVVKGKPLLLQEHLERLYRGCERLLIPVNKTRLVAEMTEACQQAYSKTNTECFVLRVSVTMGEGGRGYRNPTEPKSTRILSFSSFPSMPESHWESGINLGMASIRLALQPALAGIKHSNRLEQVIARSQWQEGWDEAVVLDGLDSVIEGTQSNLFVLKNGMLKTPDLSASGVVGVMREYILANATRLGVATQITTLKVADLESADAIMMSNSLIGVWPVRQFFGQHYENFRLSHKLLEMLRNDGAIPTH